MKKIALGFIIGFILACSINVFAEDITANLINIFDSDTGGKIELQDINRNANVRIGSERKGGDNIGGTLVLYNRSIEKPRVTAGVLSEEDAGTLQALDKNSKVRIQIQAENKKYGNNAFIGIRDNEGVIKTYFTESSGFIGGDKVITEDYLNEFYVSKEEVQRMIEEALKNYK